MQPCSAMTNGAEHPFELADIARVDRLQLRLERRRCGLHRGELADVGDRRFTQHRHAKDWGDRSVFRLTSGYLVTCLSSKN